MARKRTAPNTTADGRCAVGYLRVSTIVQVESGAGLDAQRRSIEGQALAAGLEVVEWVEDGGVSGKVAPDRRPALGPILARLDSGEFCALIVGKADRLGRSTRDLLALVDRADQHGWRLVIGDMSLDTGSPTGRLMLTMLAAVAEFERARIAERISEALVSRKAQGVRLGRRVEMAPDVRARIVDLRAAGMTLAAIAHQLTDEGVATVRGGARWYPSTVKGVLASVDLDREMVAR